MSTARRKKNLRKVVEGIHNYNFLTGSKSFETAFIEEEGAGNQKLTKRKRKVQEEPHHKSAKISEQHGIYSSCVNTERNEGEESEDSTASENSQEDFFGLEKIRNEGSYRLETQEEQLEREKQTNSDREEETVSPLLKAQEIINNSQIYNLNYQQMIQSNPSLPENKPSIWWKSSLKYSPAKSILTNYKCWKCEKVGHLSEDCTVIDHLSQSDSENIASLSPYLRKLYKTFGIFGKLEREKTNENKKERQIEKDKKQMLPLSCSIQLGAMLGL